MGWKLSFQGIDTWEISDVLTTLHEADRCIHAAVGLAIPHVATVVGIFERAIERGGRVHYFGAGTSGRLAALDAYECPPTFGVSARLLQAHLAGGIEAFAHPVESMEDNREQGAADVTAAEIGHDDVVLGVSASGTTPYVLGALAESRRRGAQTAGLACAVGSELSHLADHMITVDVGPEVLDGSTRLKAGTAQKMVLNMLSTATFTRLGFVFDGLMVGVQPENAKLQDRAVTIIRRITGTEDAQARAMLTACGMDVRATIVALARRLEPAEAQLVLSRVAGNLRSALTLVG